MQNVILFEDINFHDCKIYAIGFNTEKNQLLIDIDFITEWITKNDNKNYSFCVVPSTLVFENVWDVNMDISMDMELIIDTISRSNPVIPKNIDYLSKSAKEYDWTIELLQGEIRFKSIAIKICQRGETFKQKMQVINLKHRGGISLKEEGDIYYID